jgi:hypothetical protein
MYGNVWEWCADGFADDYYRKSTAADPISPATDFTFLFMPFQKTMLVYRGCSRQDDRPDRFRSASRHGSETFVSQDKWKKSGAFWSIDIGFRVARTTSGADTSSPDSAEVPTKKSGSTPGGAGASADQGFSYAAADAAVKITAEADLKKIVAITGSKATEAIRLVSVFARPFIWRHGKFNPRTANPQTFNAAVAHISEASITTAERLLLKEGDRPRVLAFVCLVGAASNFVPESGRVHTKAFDLALNNLSRANMEKARDLINDPEGSEPLFVLLRASGYYVNDKGEFNAAAFDAGLESVRPDDLARVRREASCAESEDALDLLLQQKSTARTQGRDQPSKEAKGESEAQQRSK